MRLEQKEYDKLKAKVKKKLNTKDGRKMFLVCLVCFIAGMMWQFLFILALVIGIGYLLVSAIRKDETKKQA